MRIPRHEEVVDVIELILDRWDRQAASDPKATGRARAWYLHDALLANGILIFVDEGREIDRVAAELTLIGMDKDQAIAAIDAAIKGVDDPNRSRSDWLNGFIAKCKEQLAWNRGTTKTE